MPTKDSEDNLPGSTTRERCHRRGNPDAHPPQRCRSSLPAANRINNPETRGAHPFPFPFPAQPSAPPAPYRRGGTGHPAGSTTNASKVEHRGHGDTPRRPPRPTAHYLAALGRVVGGRRRGLRPPRHERDVLDELPPPRGPRVAAFLFRVRPIDGHHLRGEEGRATPTARRRGERLAIGSGNKRTGETDHLRGTGRPRQRVTNG